MASQTLPIASPTLGDQLGEVVTLLGVVAERLQGVVLMVIEVWNHMQRTTGVTTRVEVLIEQVQRTATLLEKQIAALEHPDEEWPH